MKENSSWICSGQDMARHAFKFRDFEPLSLSMLNSKMMSVVCLGQHATKVRHSSMCAVIMRGSIIHIHGLAGTRQKPTTKQWHTLQLRMLYGFSVKWNERKSETKSILNPRAEENVRMNRHLNLLWLVPTQKTEMCCGICHDKRTAKWLKFSLILTGIQVWHIEWEPFSHPHVPSYRPAFTMASALLEARSKDWNIDIFPGICFGNEADTFWHSIRHKSGQMLWTMIWDTFWPSAPLLWHRLCDTWTPKADSCSDV